MSHKTWVLVADAARARIFHTDTRLTEWEEAEDLYNPAGRLKESELVSDTHAHSTGRGARSGPTSHGTQHDEAVRRFAKEIATRLDLARGSGGFNRLVVVAPAGFLGSLRGELSKPVASTVQVELSKDYTKLASAQVRARLSDALAGQPVGR